MNSFQEVLETAFERSTREWLYLPFDREWSLASEATTLESEEVPPELEDEPDAGVPIIAKRNNLMQVMPVATLQDIIVNAKMYKPEISNQQLFEAFLFYYNNDAFKKIH